MKTLVWLLVIFAMINTVHAEGKLWSSAELEAKFGGAPAASTVVNKQVPTFESFLISEGFYSGLRIGLATGKMVGMMTFAKGYAENFNIPSITNEYNSMIPQANDLISKYDTLIKQSFGGNYTRLEELTIPTFTEIGQASSSQATPAWIPAVP
jgi:hypothetical protein